MPEQIEKRTFEDIAAEIGTSPSYIEKDYYAVRILNALSKIVYENASLVFTGGTCLSKGYKLIKRFSEDIDFRIHTIVDYSRQERKDIREYIISKIKALPDFKYMDSSLKKLNDRRFFSFDVAYPRLFNDDSIRNDLRLEFTMENVLLPTNICNIRSIAAEYEAVTETATEINCISHIEIGADKLSAFMWRVIKRDRTKALFDSENDPTIIRHLHDLAALEKVIVGSEDFIKSFKSIRIRSIS
ncbi:MAG: nucleotidyl transferase AbiEii/AbiGii toxin family protein [Brevinematales bacterium]|jgi:predicted nucleotidyltransferase component of viral defense system